MSASAKSVAAKLQIKPGASVWLSDAAHADRLGPLPEGVRVATTLSEATVALIFASGATTLRALLDAHRADLTRPTALWVAYPKANRADINRDTLWPILAEYGRARLPRSPWTRSGRRCASGR